MLSMFGWDLTVKQGAKQWEGGIKKQKPLTNSHVIIEELYYFIIL